MGAPNRGRMRVVLIVFFLGLLSQVSGFLTFLTPKVGVYLINELGPGKKLTLHCRSKDKDLGWHQISFLEMYGWHFRINLWRTTLFWCNFSWYNAGIRYDGSFKIYDAARDEGRCAVLCDWKVRPTGLYAYTNEIGTYERLYRWPVPDKTVSRK
ncbi:hypothetical protein L1049_019522 [Liquidambar formosana]|uniref:S-protein homolog n=1 Tax=Liquidambar formosana TaxID=63359 RepID=A0AAP0SCQ6_LIQFO